MNLSAVVGEPAAQGKRREATVAHTRILRTTLATDDCYAYWQKVDTRIPPSQRARGSPSATWWRPRSSWATCRQAIRRMVQLRQGLKREVNLPEELTEKLVSSLGGVSYLGSLLKVDSAIEAALREAERQH